MAHLTARKSLEVIPGQFDVTTALMHVVAQGLADCVDIEIIAQKANRAYHCHELPGIPNPRIGPDGRTVDNERTRAYALSEIAAVAALPQVAQLVDEIKASRAEQAEQVRKDALADQLAEARFIKACRREAKATPNLYREVQRLQEQVAWLVDQVGRISVGGGELPDIEARMLPDRDDLDEAWKASRKI